jgi:glycopeptide antibiotics resistance protein
MTSNNTPCGVVERVAFYRVRSLARLAFLILLGLILYLTVKPNPSIKEIQWMPKESTVFFDLHDGWKNALGYGALALAGFIGWPKGWGRHEWKPGSRKRAQLIALCGVVVFMELLQLFIPTRFCDIKDMTVGSFGVLVTWCVATITERIIRLPTGKIMADH